MPKGLPISIESVSITVPGGGVLVDPLTGKHHCRTEIRFNLADLPSPLMLSTGIFICDHPEPVVNTYELPLIPGNLMFVSQQKEQWMGISEEATFNYREDLKLPEGDGFESGDGEARIGRNIVYSRARVARRLLKKANSHDPLGGG